MHCSNIIEFSKVYFTLTAIVVQAHLFHYKMFIVSMEDFTDWSVHLDKYDTKISYELGRELVEYCIGQRYISRSRLKQYGNYFLTFRFILYS